MRNLSLQSALLGFFTFSFIAAACGGSTAAVGADASAGDAPGTTDSPSAKDVRADGVSPADAPVSDAPSPNDASTPDSSTPDSSTPDSSTPDSSTPDSSTPDASTGDAATGDAATDAPDGTSPTDAGHGDSGTPADAGTPHDTGSDVGTPVDCPPTLPSGDCTLPEGLHPCVYPGHSCSCTFGQPPTDMRHWECTTLAPDCPDPEPAIGSACGDPGLVCDYGMCSGGEKVTCTDGAWARSMTGGCPG